MSSPRKVSHDPSTRPGPPKACEGRFSPPMGVSFRGSGEPLHSAGGIGEYIRLRIRDFRQAARATVEAIDLLQFTGAFPEKEECLVVLLPTHGADGGPVRSRSQPEQNPRLWGAVDFSCPPEGQGIFVA